MARLNLAARCRFAFLRAKHYDFDHIQLLAFLRAAAAEGAIAEPRLLLENLEAGHTLDELMRPTKEEDALELELKVKRLAPRTFRVTLGYHGALVGDGGTWRVVFTAKGAVQRLEAEVYWRA